MGFIVPVIKAVAAVVAKSAVAKAVVKIAAAAIISKVATKAISKLIAKRLDANVPSGADAGGRVQLPPAADNKLPIVYGTSWVGGPVIDAKISTDQKFMWYVIALSEKPDGQTITFDTTDGVYYGGKKVQFGSNGVVNALITNTTPAQIDTKMAGKIYIWLFENGANNVGVNSGSQTAYQIMTDATTGGGIQLPWSDTIYTANGQSVQLNNMAFAIVRVEYNVDATTTSLDTLQVKLSNNMGGDNGCKPGIAILDYLTNERYGCAIPLSLVDTTSLALLDNYSDEYITYIPAVGGYAQQRRYRVNGPLDTGNDCLTNLQFLADTCDSWLQYTETTGKWRIVPNRPYTGTLANLFNVNAKNEKSCNVIGGIQINPIDLNDTYNQVEVAYPNTNVKDQTDYQTVDLTDPSTAWYATFNQVLSPNEAINRLNIALPLVNNAVQAKYLAVRRLLQSREDLVISCQTDYSGIQIDAGDVIRVNHEAYGWTDKLFRVSSVSEVQDEEGNLSALIEAFEYNDTIYADNAIQDFVPADNTGLKDPNVISPPCRPVVTPFTDSESLITGFTVTSCVPDEGIVIYMDFNYGNSSNVQTHQLYRTVQSAGGLPFINSDSANGYYNDISINVNDLPANTYYWSVTARNDFAGRNSDASSPFSWGGANITPYNPNTGNGGLPPNVYPPNSIPGNAIIGGTSSLAIYDSNNVLVANRVQNIQFENLLLNPTANGNITITKLGISNVPVIPNYFYSVNNNFSNTTTMPVNVNTFSANIRTEDFKVPKYIEGTSVNANVIWPYVQGTSTTGTGYLRNSTAPFEPALAAILNIENGDHDWYVLDYYPYNFSVPSGSTLNFIYEATLYANTDSEIQLATIVSTIGDNILVTDTGAFLQQHSVPANVPYKVTVTEQILNDLSYDGSGIFIRNMTPNSNVSCVSAVMGVFWVIGPF